MKFVITKTHIQNSREEWVELRQGALSNIKMPMTRRIKETFESMIELGEKKNIEPSEIFTIEPEIGS